MVRETIEVGIVVERRRLKSTWADHAWLPIGVLPGVPAAAAWSILEEGPDTTRFYGGPLPLHLFGSETGMYRDNLQSGRPSLWVVLAPADGEPGVSLKAVTADPAEGEAMTGPGTYIVEPVPMPVEIEERLAAFVAAHHVEREFVKRKRDRADPELLASRPGGPDGRKGGR
jgi:hypothetical protein